ncbi:MAG: TetR/AcrR family transcriptional regulator [Hyphomicrobiales bacterium]|nr:TetR/AcrR family transcriptional regulator [Hyphomicrobiales bacterium]MBV9910883.1 TetR/AcrR family transcriptional regulator [Hyphomicrobiales bacterium]
MSADVTRRAPAGKAPTAARKPRADAQRNRDSLLEAAKAAFAEAGPEASLDEIARRASVGIGTLYRHFPTRDAVVEAVYRREVQQLADAAPRLIESLAPAEALRAWMRLFIDYIAAKRVIAPALKSLVGGGSSLYADSSARINEAMALLVERAREGGDIRPDADSADLLRALIGFAYVNSAPDWEASARRLIDLLIDGLRSQRGEAPRPGGLAI